MKKILAVMLSLAMLLGLMPAAMASESERSDTVAEAVELADVSRLDTAELSGGRQPAAQRLYDDGDIVTVIVQLESPSLLDYYHPGYFAGDGVTAGEAVSQFLEDPEVQAASEEMLSQQEELLWQIGGLQASSLRAYSARSEGVKVLAQWTAVINGMAIQVPYGALSAIRDLDGVKRAYVEHTYAAPEPVLDGAGNAGFSYDMVELGEAWGAGYTGKGMLVAVVDTGLDLEYASFWDDGVGGNVTGIRRTHEAFREGSFKSEFDDSELRYTQASIETLLKKHTLKAHTLTSPSAVDEAAYKNRKVPYAFDYAGDADEYGTIISGDVNVYPGQGGNNHGTHVAGTVAGYVKTEDGAVKFSGVAPDAQLMIMKVFADEGGGATDSAIMNALEDTLILGADVVNLSLGSDNGFAHDDTPQAEVYEKLEAAGLILMTSAGNSAYSSTNNARGDYNLAEDPDITMMSSPAIYSSNISVASINNTVNSQMTLVWSDGTDHKAAYTDPYDVAMRATFADIDANGIEIIPAGYGSYEDYSQANFNNGYNNGRTGIALVQRGGKNAATGEPLSFSDKVRNADSFTGTNSRGDRYGVVGVIIYDNDPNSTELINMSVENANLTSAFISYADGSAMIKSINEGKSVKLTKVNQEDEIVPYADGGEMSSFTSWGAGPGLELKPEITAPGGNIWSTVFDTSYRGGSGCYDDYDGAYAMMSGTSMAAPHMSGLAALVRQYVQESGKASGAAAADLTNHLLVSTAVPQMQEDGGAYYSPRRQGAGLVDVGAAIATPAYISVEGQPVGKLELLDDPDWTGRYALSFQVNNLTNTAVTYAMEAAVQRPDTEEKGGHTFVLDSDALIKTVDLGSVTVPANGSVTVNKSIQLTAGEIADLRSLFPNGAYIEGFIMLTSGGGEPPIGLPYLAFLGDWTAAPIFDSTLWTDGDNPWEDGDYTWFPSLLGSAIINGYEVVGWLNLGQNIFDPTSADTQTAHKEGNLTISPNGDGYFDAIDDIELYQLRDAKMMVVEVRDADTDELYFRDFATYNSRTLYDANYGVAIPSSLYYFTEENWGGTDLEGNRLPSGTRCIYTITAYGEGDYATTEYEGFDNPITDFWSVDPSDPGTEPAFNGHAMDKTGDVISFPVVVDYVAPKLENNAVSVYEEDGRTYIEGTVYDEDGSLASVEIHPVVTRRYKEGYGDAALTETGMDMSNPFYSEVIHDEAMKTWTFKADVTEYAHTNESYPGENSYYDFAWTGNVNISCGDYGANDRTYAVKVADMAQPGEILLSQTSALLHPGSTFELSVVDNSDAGAAITRTSSDPDVAVVDEFGNVTAVAPGQATITVSNGVSSAVCIVAVEAYSTEVIDFDLSIDHFEGLKAGAPITVNVTNLQPADVAIENITWLVYEDDEDWGGVVDVYRNSADALSGQIELTINSSEELIPGGSGYLEVTINGVSRRMTFTWEDIPTSSAQDDLVSAENYGEQTVYVPYGETATLTAKYKQNHDFIPVELYTAEGAESGQLNSTDPAAGLILDAPPFANTNGEWSGRIVNEEGYALPDSIKLFTRYDGEYEVEISNYSWSTNYTYDSRTGEIWVAHAPSGSSSIMVIRADGVESEGAPAGEPSGEEYEMPDGTYGPFDWDFTPDLDSVAGDLEMGEETDHYGNVVHVARFTPSEPGVSYITASSRDGQYSVNFAVVCEPVIASELTLNVNSLELEAGETGRLIPTLSPEPTLEKHAEILWTSFNPDVAQVDEDGQVTGVSSGYAYIKAAVRTDTTVQSCCIVKVSGGMESGSYGISYELNGGRWLSSSFAPSSYTVSEQEQVLDVSIPFRAGYTFLGWTYGGQSRPTRYVRLPAGFTGDLVLCANWEPEYDDPAPVIPAPRPSGTEEPSAPQKPAIKVSTSDETNNTTVTTAVPDAVVTGNTAVSTVTGEMGREIVSQAVDRGSATVVIAPEMPEGVTRTEVSLPAETVGEIAGKTEARLQVVTPVASVTIPHQALSDLAAEGGQVTVSAEQTGSMVEVVVAANGSQVKELNGGLEVRIPQTDCGPGAVAMLVHEDGTMTVVRQSVAGSDGQSITVPLDGSARVIIMDNSRSFADIPASSWAAGAVAFASSHELMNGTEEGVFDPNASMTRAMLATVLHNLEGNPPHGAGSVFPDVSAGAWYAEAVSWAAGNSIVSGYADGSFGPLDPITREQLAVMLYRYAGSPAAEASLDGFADAGAIGGYARDAVAWAVASGVMKGKGGAVLDPQGTATRAEVAQMLLNFMSASVK